ncbi:vacuolar H+-ATPase V0 sector, subunits a [Emiliania huxleyi CCMP1516]|uniref:V-type proton ATPase subunit a n=2 Tax=Emiliania huxleyi TaxID=2903 RepID=A0A0D3JI85_EMIH1|nr:vacuolar H+-ATPase V0 sector, subunits a [Emiliania huxleyi CCMP1516]EOD23220.1 vacuolar H+-ATPase V0 sector, subunits a [Emiliania huxleyi CCMP1516]|eukprot:XP_005775649.1 vacuolar H+-ATPase V0 sector, subunits a [Emiliania huxleyi CCMP1516]
MGDLWRSKKMSLVQLVVQNGAAHAVVSKLGELGMMQLRDLNAGQSFFKRSFVRECDDLQRILRSVEEQLVEAGIAPSSSGANDPSLPSLDTVDAKLRAAEVEFYKTGAAPALSESDMATSLLSLTEFGGQASSMLSVLAGVIKTESVAALERVVFRATRGNAVFQQKTVKTKLLDTSGKVPELVQKTFFMVFFSGAVLGDKVSKIATYFGATLYKYPSTALDHAAMTYEVHKRKADHSQVLEQSTAILRGALTSLAAAYGPWARHVHDIAQVYDALNKCEFDLKRAVFIAEGWVATDEYEALVTSLQSAAVAQGLDTRPIINLIQSKLTPPTYVPTNAFTSGFQALALVNTYGTPRYREVNPGAFCCILFPYLFGIMFGDFGHGLLFAGFGYWLISKEKEWEGKDLGDMLEMVYGGRYICFLNGLFGAFVGLLYNEAFAFPMGFFGTSRWEGFEEEGLSGMTVDERPLADRCELSGPIYPVGIDPIWHVTENKITFFNSLKMKISIVVGVLQMSLGIYLSLLNHLEYKDVKKVLFQFIPEVTFFGGIFGYLVLTIFMKWSTDWSCPLDHAAAEAGLPAAEGGICQPAPSLLTLLINMFMSPTADITVPLYGIECFGGAGNPDCAGVAEAGYCVPILLLAIPLIEIYQHSGNKYDNLDEDDHEAEDDGHAFSAGDAFIHQGIHTIEFVLGGISNTAPGCLAHQASYLRLWALSLAHSQLAELFKDMILGAAPNPALAAVATFIAFSMWAIISLIVLMAMENLSSFLHALRLQWVEFQNKFYYGDGQKWSPFAFAAIGSGAED